MFPVQQPVSVASHAQPTGLSRLSYSQSCFHDLRGVSSPRYRMSPFSRSPGALVLPVRTKANRAPQAGFSPALPYDGHQRCQSQMVFQSRPGSKLAYRVETVGLLFIKEPGTQNQFPVRRITRRSTSLSWISASRRRRGTLLCFVQLDWGVNVGRATPIP